MKYETNTKTTRNTSLVKLKLANSELSLKEIGEIFGITKQRVHQILKRYNKEWK